MRLLEEDSMAFGINGFSVNLASHATFATVMAVSLGAASAGILVSVTQPQGGAGAICADPYGGCLPTLEPETVPHPLFRADNPRLHSKPDDSREGDAANWVFIGLLGVLALVCVVGVVRDGMTSVWNEGEEADGGCCE